MIKNIVSWFAMLALAGALAACGQNQEGGTTDSAAPQQPESAPADQGQGQPPAGQ
jgi:hypothetical protein